MLYSTDKGKRVPSQTEESPQGLGTLLLIHFLYLIILHNKKFLLTVLEWTL